MRITFCHRTVISYTSSLAIHCVLLGAGIVASQMTGTSTERAQFFGTPHTITLEWNQAESPSTEPMMTITGRPTEMTVTPHEVRVLEHVYVDKAAAELRVSAPMPMPIEPSEVSPEIPHEAPPRQGPTVAHELPLANPSPANSEVHVVQRDRSRGQIASPAMAPSSLSAGQIGIAPPDFSQNSPPIYPDIARANGWQGTVMLRLSVSATGAVTHVEIEQSSGYLVLDAAAVMAVRNWRGTPSLVGGVPVSSREMQEIRFLMR